VLSGEEEGKLVYLAVRNAIDGPRYFGPVDVGGGSTEWCVVRSGELRGVRSLKLGSLRCAGLLDGDPPTTASIERLRRRVREALEGVRVPAKLERLIATSGTAICCGELAEVASGRDRSLTAGGLRELRLRELGEVIGGLRALERKQIARWRRSGRAGRLDRRRRSAEEPPAMPGSITTSATGRCARGCARVLGRAGLTAGRRRRAGARCSSWPNALRWRARRAGGAPGDAPFDLPPVMSAVGERLARGRRLSTTSAIRSTSSATTNTPTT
jgi:hypothetical protein